MFWHARIHHARIPGTITWPPYTISNSESQTPLLRFFLRGGRSVHMLSLSHKSIICLSQLATSKSRYFVQPHPIIVNYFIPNCHDCLHLKFVVTKTWNDLKPPKTIYNHLQPPQKIQQPPTTTSKTSTTTRKQSKTGSEIRRDDNMSRTWNTTIEQNSWTKQPLLPKILLSLIPCIINHWLRTKLPPRCPLMLLGLGYKVDFVYSLLWNSSTIWL